MSGAFFNNINMVKDIILAVLIVLILALIWVTIYDSNRFTVSNYKYKNAKIKKPFRAVVVTDLHNKKYGPGNDLLVEAIKKAKPDIMIIAGDIMNGHPQSDLKTAFEFLEKVAPICRIYYGNGNHETRMHLYVEDYGSRYSDFTEKLEALQIHHLVNARETLDEYGVEIIGLELARNHYIRFKPEPIEKGELAGVLGKVDNKKYSIMIAHNPYFFRDYAEYGANLVLSGHVHGGIVRIPIVNKGVLSPNIAFFPKYDAGEFTERETSMIVSRGLGAHTIPFRMFNPGDLVVIDFEP